MQLKALRTHLFFYLTCTTFVLFLPRPFPRVAVTLCPVLYLYMCTFFAATCVSRDRRFLKTTRGGNPQCGHCPLQKCFPRQDNWFVAFCKPVSAALSGINQNDCVPGARHQRHWSIHSGSE